MKLIIALLLLIPIIVFGEEKQDPQHKNKVGDIAPDFTLTYVDGSTKKLSDLRGKVVMLQFTASWCSICNKEMPFIQKEIWEKHSSDNNFFLAGVDFKEDTTLIGKFIKKTGIKYPLLLDPEGTIFELYAEKDAGVTRNIIIDRNGKIAFQTRLFNRTEFDAMKKVIAQLLAEK